MVREVVLDSVVTRSQWSEFIALPWAIYGDDPHWVPPLRKAVRDVLDTRKNPFFKHARLVGVVARDPGTREVRGRIIGVIDENHNRFHGEKTAFFGFFEAYDDSKVAAALFQFVREWAKSQGMNQLRGPMNPSSNHECGLLIEGFEDAPSVMMTYNPPYYAKLFSENGFEKAKDLYAYDIDHRTATHLGPMAEQQARLSKTAGVVIRPARMRDFDAEIEKILAIYNDAWEKNWGFVPMEPEEFRHMARDMKAIVDPNMLLIAEVNGEAAGFGLALPDVNRALKKVKNGRLTPGSVARLLWDLKGPGRRKTLNRARVITLGVRKRFRPLGLGPLLYLEYIRRGPANGYPSAECSWILEDNGPMNQALRKIGAKRSKVYRIYERAI